MHHRPMTPADYSAARMLWACVATIVGLVFSRCEWNRAKRERRRTGGGRRGFGVGTKKPPEGG